MVDCTVGLSDIFMKSLKLSLNLSICEVIFLCMVKQTSKKLNNTKEDKTSQASQQIQFSEYSENSFAYFPILYQTICKKYHLNLTCISSLKMEMNSSVKLVLANKQKYIYIYIFFIYILKIDVFTVSIVQCAVYRIQYTVYSIQ